LEKDSWELPSLIDT